MRALYTYLPQDRLHAFANNITLPDRATGSALFADISGFTQLTETLRDSLGARRGAEELAKHLEAVYTALISEVEKYGGSVISFAGDAITCWFDDSNYPAAPRAATCALALQGAMRAFSFITLPNGMKAALTLKVAVASGHVRRLAVGDPTINYLDALAGATVTRTSTAEHLANKGDVLVDEATAQNLGDTLSISEWRADKESKERFGVVSKYSGKPVELNAATIPALNDDVLENWVLPALRARSSFLAEFRPCAAMFVSFTGIDYDSDEAETQLNIFIRNAQRIAARYDGGLISLTIGDKGSYAYINFGALSTHEDNARRAVKAALELRNAASSLYLQIGLTQGMMFAGAYGGPTRRTYSVMGDDVNLAARLMQTAILGEILVSGSLQKAVEQSFTFEPRPPLPMKGKTEPLPVFAVTGERQQRAIRLQEPTYALPMVGRRRELQIINEKLGLTLQGKSQVIGIVAEAGMGKSRLIAEVIRAARKIGFVGYGGACQSDGVQTPYLAWKSVWSAFFDVDPAAPLRKQIRSLEGEIEDRASSRVEALPLLGKLLDLNIPDNEFTQSLEPKIRQSALHALLEDCLKAAAKDEPLLVVIEDLHWIDAVSHDLLEELAKALAHHPVCFVLAYRPPQMERLQAPHLETLPQFTKIELHELNQMESEQAIRAKLAQLYPARSGAVPSMLVEKLMARAQGNPFYLEELLNYLRDRGLDPREPSALEKIELPDSLHTLILSRIDQLSEREKITLRVASIIGRLFRTDWLMGYYDELGELPKVKTDLEQLSALDITPLDTPEPELTYLFKHIVTHEVTYESLPFATRSKLHEQLARYLETTYPDEPPLETLVFHYLHSDNTAKKCEYLRKAGEAAQQNFANDAVLIYYGQLLPLLSDIAEKIKIEIKRGEVLQLTGQFAEAEAGYHTALKLAQNAQDAAATARAQIAMGKLFRQRGDYDAALAWFAQAKTGYTSLGDRAGLRDVLNETGVGITHKGEYAQAREILNAALTLAHETDDKAAIAQALNNLGNVAWSQSDYAAGRALFEESLTFWRELGNKWGIANSLTNLGNVAYNQGDYHTAQALYQESLTLRLEMGDKGGNAILHTNLGNVALAEVEYTHARELYEKGLELGREMGDKYIMAISLTDLGIVAHMQGDYTAAQALFKESLALRHEMGDKGGMAYALLGLGLAELASGTAEAREHITESLRLRHEISEQVPLTSSLIGMAGLAIHMGNAHRAVQLLGAVESTLKALQAPMEPELRLLHTETLASARTTLGEATFQSALEAGGKLSLEEAVKLALKE